MKNKSIILLLVLLIVIVFITVFVYVLNKDYFHELITEHVDNKIDNIMNSSEWNDLTDEQKKQNIGSLLQKFEKRGYIKDLSFWEDEDSYYFEYIDGSLGGVSFRVFNRKGPVEEISGITQIEEYEFEQMNYVDETINELINSAEWKTMSINERKEKAEILLNKLEEEGYIQNVIFGEAYVYSFQYNNGVLGGLMIKDFEPYMN